MFLLLNTQIDSIALKLEIVKTLLKGRRKSASPLTVILNFNKRFYSFISMLFIHEDVSNLFVALPFFYFGFFYYYFFFSWIS